MRFPSWTMGKVAAAGAVVTGAAAFVISRFRSNPPTPSDPEPRVIELPCPSQYSGVSQVTLPPGSSIDILIDINIYVINIRPNTSGTNTREQDSRSAEEKQKNMANQLSIVGWA